MLGWVGGAEDRTSDVGENNLFRSSWMRPFLVLAFSVPDKSWWRERMQPDLEHSVSEHVFSTFSSTNG